MGLSITHINLVRSLSSWVSENCDADEYSIMLIDLPETLPNNKPYTVGGFVPDLYIHHKRRVLGEAKTSGDIETKHSRDQYIAYLKHLRNYKDSIFLVAVPWHCVAQMRSLVTKLKKDHDAENVKTIFIDKLPG